MNWLDQLPLFTLAFTSLFPLINPVGTALIVDSMLGPRDKRKAHAFTVVFYAAIVGLVTLFCGSWVLKFMGVSIPTTQMAGGFVIAKMGLGILNADPEPQRSELSKKSSPDDSLFYPIAFPLLLGPGGCSALIALSAHTHSPNFELTMLKWGVIALALLTVLAMAYFCFIYSSVLIKKMGTTGSLALNRMVAFLVFCVGLQMLFAGFSELVPPLLHK